MEFVGYDYCKLLKDASTDKLLFISLKESEGDLKRVAEVTCSETGSRTEKKRRGRNEKKNGRRGKREKADSGA